MLNCKEFGDFIILLANKEKLFTLFKFKGIPSLKNQSVFNLVFRVVQHDKTAQKVSKTFKKNFNNKE